MKKQVQTNNFFRFSRMPAHRSEEHSHKLQGVINQVLTVILLLLITTIQLNAQDLGFQWVKGILDDGVVSPGTYVLSITTDASGNIYATGYFDGTVDFDPGPGVFNLTSSGPLLRSA